MHCEVEVGWGRWEAVRTGAYICIVWCGILKRKTTVSTATSTSTLQLQQQLQQQQQHTLAFRRKRGERDLDLDLDRDRDRWLADNVVIIAAASRESPHCEMLGRDDLSAQLSRRGAPSCGADTSNSSCTIVTASSAVVRGAGRLLRCRRVSFEDAFVKNSIFCASVKNAPPVLPLALMRVAWCCALVVAASTVDAASAAATAAILFSSSMFILRSTLLTRSSKFVLTIIVYLRTVVSIIEVSACYQL